MSTDGLLTQLSDTPFILPATRSALFHSVAWRSIFEIEILFPLQRAISDIVSLVDSTYLLKNEAMRLHCML
jgi:hypothetical protein